MSRAARIGLVALSVVTLAVLAVVVLGGDRDPYRLAVGLDSANGLREGTPVKIAGAQVGTIDHLRVLDDDSVRAELALDGDKVRHIGANASARVLASNLLGSKYIELQPGDARGPEARSIPVERVQYPVDLDQVLNVLDADTRTRLQILINEAGIAMTGRHTDFNVVLRQLPHDFAAAQRLLARVTADNRALGQAVAHSSSFVTKLAAERGHLGRVADVTQRTMTTVGQRRAALRATFARAPRTLATARTFLSDLHSAAAPLRPAARAITATAPRLTAALGELPAFQRAAAPVMRESRQVAPSLTRLGLQATPIVRRALPALSSVAGFTRASGPLARTLDVSIDDINAVLEGWARSIQQGDSLGHIFRGKALVSAEALRTVLDHDLPASARRKKAKRGHPSHAPAAQPGTGDGQAHDPAAPKAGTLELKLPVLPPIRLPAPKPTRAPESTRTENLLDYLLGK